MYLRACCPLHGAAAKLFMRVNQCNPPLMQVLLIVNLVTGRCACRSRTSEA